MEGRAKAAYYQSDVRTARFGTLAWLTGSCMRTPKTSRHTNAGTSDAGLARKVCSSRPCFKAFPTAAHVSTSLLRRGNQCIAGCTSNALCQFGPSRSPSSQHRWSVPTRKAVCSMRPVRTRPPRAIFGCQGSRSMFLTPRQCWARWKSDKRLVFSDGRSSPSMPNSTGNRT